MQLEPPDLHYVSSAIGWAELGNLDEAKAELDHVDERLREHPEVIEARWVIAAAAKDWQEALRLAKLLLQRVPENPSGWLHVAYALRRVPGGGLKPAWTALRPAWEKFPKEPIIAYNLACYSCQMKQLRSAKAWLKKAFKVGGKDRIKGMALQDPDLEPLWGEISVL